MSWQQVNLYLPELKPKVEVVSIKLATLTLVVVFAVVVMQSLMGAFENQRLKKNVLGIESELVELRQDIEKLKASLPLSQASLVQREVDDLRIELLRKQRIYQLINQQKLGNSLGFSTQLTALARQHDKAISLSRFEFRLGGQRLDFFGQARSAEVLPQYLQRLQNEEAFKTTAFGDLVIESAKAGLVDFRLGEVDKLSKVGR